MSSVDEWFEQEMCCEFADVDQTARVEKPDVDVRSIVGRYSVAFGVKICKRSISSSATCSITYFPVGDATA